MDLNLKALIGVTYLVPIALTLRKVYVPNFDMPEAFTAVLAKMDAGRGPSRRAAGYIPRQQAHHAHDLVF